MAPLTARGAKSPRTPTSPPLRLPTDCLVPYAPPYSTSPALYIRVCARVRAHTDSEDLPGSGAREYAARLPYFSEARRLAELVDQQTQTMRSMVEDHKKEVQQADNRGQALVGTMKTWNRAMGATAASATADELRVQLAALEAQLKAALEEIDRLKALGDDAVKRCCEAYDACTEEQQGEVLARHVLPSPALPSAVAGMTLFEVSVLVRV